MAGVNKVILVGRLGKDPEVRTLTNGNTVANFSMATSESWKDKTTGEKKETTEWHNVVLWGAMAGVAQKYLHKGDLIYIEGKLNTQSWEKDGVTRYTTRIIANVMNMLGSRSGNAGQVTPAQSQPHAQPTANAPDAMIGSDDLPF